jgi:hypothetical protein
MSDLAHRPRPITDQPSCNGCGTILGVRIVLKRGKRTIQLRPQCLIEVSQEAASHGDSAV